MKRSKVSRKKKTKNFTKRKNVVVIGGGTGTYTVLSGIKHLENINITAIVTSTDSGGSTGVLRDQFGRLPVGDFRQCLVALAETGNGDNLLRELFKYRFEKGGKGLEGHNLGNLFITALSDILGSDQAAFEKISDILRIKGEIHPITYEDIQLIAEYENGEIAYGEANIDEPDEKKHDGSLRIKKLWVHPKAKISPQAKNAILNADLIILGPGDLYTSILANFVIGGVSLAVRKSNAKILYISNLFSKWGQTHNMAVSDYVKELEKYLKTEIDYILINNRPITNKKALKMYEAEKAYPVVDDLRKNDRRAIRTDLIYDKVVERKYGDKVKRSLIRHDYHKVASEIERLLKI